MPKANKLGFGFLTGLFSLVQYFRVRLECIYFLLRVPLFQAILFSQV
jgi:hypothetical protein